MSYASVFIFVFAFGAVLALFYSFSINDVPTKTCQRPKFRWKLQKSDTHDGHQPQLLFLLLNFSHARSSTVFYPRSQLQSPIGAGFLMAFKMPTKAEIGKWHKNRSTAGIQVPLLFLWRYEEYYSRRALYLALTATARSSRPSPLPRGRREGTWNISQNLNNSQLLLFIITVGT